MRATWGLSPTRVLMWVGLWERAARNNPCESNMILYINTIGIHEKRREKCSRLIQTT